MAPRKKATKVTDIVAAATAIVTADGGDMAETLKLQALIPEVVGKEQRGSVITKILETRKAADARLIQINELEIVDEDSFKTADLLLAGSRVSEEAAGGIFGPTIKPIREGLDQLYALQREVVRPWGNCVAAALAKIKDFRRKEDAEKQRKAAEFVKAQQDAARKLEAQRVATPVIAPTFTPNYPEWTEAMAASISDPNVWINPHTTTPIARAMRPPDPAPVEADHSSTSFKEVVRVVDIDSLFCEVMNETMPIEVLMVNEAVLQTLFLNSPEKVRLCPGIKIEREPIIRRR